MRNSVLEQWHHIIQSGDFSQLDDILAEDVVFHSPVVHTPQRGKTITKQYLVAGGQLIFNEHGRYVREVVAGNNAVLEFASELEGIQINGIDMMTWNEEGLITDFKVMIRPLKAINTIHALMRERLAAGA